MKTRITLLIIGTLGAFSACNGQTSKTTSDSKEIVQEDTVIQMNLLDEQTKILGQVFALAGASEEENPVGGATNYLELIEQSEGSEELKEQLREMYDLYNTSLDPSKKEELRIKFTKMFEEAKAKSLIER